MKIKKPVSAPETQRKIKRSYLTVATVAAAVILMALPVYADDPLATINAPVSYTHLTLPTKLEV